MNNKFLFGGFVIVVFFGIMIYLFTQTNIAYQEDFSQVSETGKTVKAIGSWVREKNYDIDNEKKLFSFYIEDPQGNELKVIYKGTIPNNFESATSVVVTGKYQNGYFVAKDILTKCPSKYEGEYISDAS